MVERDVRKTLNIPFNPGAPALRYEHSMGQGLPDFIHRIGKPDSAARSACGKAGRGRLISTAAAGDAAACRWRAA